MRRGKIWSCFLFEDKNKKTPYACVCLKLRRFSFILFFSIFFSPFILCIVLRLLFKCAKKYVRYTRNKWNETRRKHDFVSGARCTDTLFPNGAHTFVVGQLTCVVYNTMQFMYWIFILFFSFHFISFFSFDLFFCDPEIAYIIQYLLTALLCTAVNVIMGKQHAFVPRESQELLVYNAYDTIVMQWCADKNSRSTQTVK